MQDRLMAMIIVFMVILSGCMAGRARHPDEMVAEMRNDMMFIDLNINGRKGKFLIDTGASVSLIDGEQSEFYRFGSYDPGNVRIKGIGGDQVLKLASTIKVAYNGVEYSGFYFYVSDFTSINHYFTRRNIKILGVVGADFLKKYNALVDFKNRLIRFDNTE